MSSTKFFLEENEDSFGPILFNNRLRTQPCPREDQDCTFLVGTAYGKYRKRRPNKHILRASHNGTDQHFCTLKLALLKTL